MEHKRPWVNHLDIPSWELNDDGWVGEERGDEAGASFERTGFEGGLNETCFCSREHVKGVEGGVGDETKLGPRACLYRVGGWVGGWVGG